jgi:hypothetical protein
MESQTFKKIPSKRRTLVIDTQIESILRNLQGELIRTEKKNYSLSRLVNIVLMTGFIGSKYMSLDEWSKIRNYRASRVIKVEFSLDEYLNHLSDIGKWV